MDINAFSDQIVTYILPYVFKATIVGGKKVVEKLGEIGGDSIADVAKEIWRKIVKRYGKDKKIKNATNVLKDDPNDGGAQMTLKNGLAACLATSGSYASLARAEWALSTKPIITPSVDVPPSR